MSKFFSFNKAIINWFNVNKRILPWRKTRDPYKIWVSEIILQQTRVNQGIDYYNRFVNKFKNIQMLADTEIGEVMKLWQGLGYYSRARHMHESAKKIMNEFGGQFPHNYKSLIKLKGVGRYTAAAIASICFDEPIPVVDGNVYRVISRFKGISTFIESNNAYSEFFKIAGKLLGNSNPGVFNQAIMELGATVCTPVHPDCEICPVNGYCYALKNNKIHLFPHKIKQPPVRIRYFNYLVLVNKNIIFLKRRVQNDIWKLLYDFPLIETKSDLSAEELFNLGWTKNYQNIQIKHILKISKTYLHKLTHQNIYAKFYKIKLNNAKSIGSEKLIGTEINKIQSFPVPRLIEKYLMDEFGVIKNMHYLSGDENSSKY
jgi:A/G-specific adenine glycosylase